MYPKPLIVTGNFKSATNVKLNLENYVVNIGVWSITLNTLIVTFKEDTDDICALTFNLLKSYTVGRQVYDSQLIDAPVALFHLKGQAGTSKTIVDNGVAPIVFSNGRQELQFNILNPVTNLNVRKNIDFYAHFTLQRIE